MLSFDSPYDKQRYKQLSLDVADFQNRSPRSEDEVRQYIVYKAYWLAYRYPMRPQQEGISFPIPFDESADLDYLQVEAADVYRVIRRLANQGQLEKVLDGNAAPTERLLQ